MTTSPEMMIELVILGLITLSLAFALDWTLKGDDIND